LANDGRQGADVAPDEHHLVSHAFWSFTGERSPKSNLVNQSDLNHVPGRDENFLFHERSGGQVRANEQEGRDDGEDLQLRPANPAEDAREIDIAAATR
jgi:hypothetical protein